MLLIVHRFLRILAVVQLVLLAVSPALADVTVSEEARVHFRKGVALLGNAAGPKFREAYREFQAAYEVSPSPKILGNLGLCAMSLERDTEAIEYYERYLTESGAVSKREHRQIIDDVIKMRGRGTQLRLAITPSEATVTDERLRDDGPPVVNDYEVKYGELEIRVHVGPHRLTVKRDGYEPVVWEFEARKRLVAKRTVELKRLAPEADPDADPSEPSEGTPTDDADEPDGGGIPTGVWIGVGATGVLAAATAVVGSLVISNKGSFDDELAAGNYDEARSLQDDGETLALVTDVLLGTTVAAATTTVILYFVLDDDGDAPETAWTVGPAVAPGWAGISVRAPF
ncbi:MAG: tetratricopeptide repeat protein [Deltaproteobacteria bacterium]|nr:tetratricopeptide repeat protein [Deltaproteobacteria bacterium]